MQQRKPKLERILARRMSKLVDERFRDEVVPVRVRRPPRTCRDAVVVLDVPYTQVRNEERRVGYVGERGRIDRTCHPLWERVAEPRRLNHLMREPDELSAGDHA